MHRTHKVLLGLASLGFFAAAPVFATSVTGFANVGGTATVNNSGVSFTNLNVPGPNTGSFAGLTSYTIDNLTGTPVSGADSIPMFATFSAAAGTIDFDLQNIAPGVGGVAGCASATVGNTCTPILPNGDMSPFTLTQTSANTVTISLTLNGIAYMGTSASGYSTSSASFTTQDLAIGTIPGILAASGTSTGVSDAFSATFSSTPVSTTPEPASLLLMGMGLLGAGLVARRKARG